MDERETGVRATLNLGHTFGHAIEAGTGFGTWLHGEAVAAGMVLAAQLSQRPGASATMADDMSSERGTAFGFGECSVFSKGFSFDKGAVVGDDFGFSHVKVCVHALSVAPSVTRAENGPQSRV